MADSVECVVVGAGVVGLAVARAMAMRGHEVVVLEQAEGIGTEVSSRNSEVIHAGIYYPTGSLRARLCVEGRHRLYDYCASHGVPHKRVGKLVVATEPAEIPALEKIRALSHANGVADVDFIEPAAARKLEPELSCIAALISPSTGIIDSHRLMLAYQGDAEDHGAMLAFHSRVLGADKRNDGYRLQVDNAGARVEIDCRILINSAALGAQRLAEGCDFLDPALIPKLWPAKGCYFTLLGKPPFERLIYPAPHSTHLGVHVTLDMGGQVKFGPDAEYVTELNYDVDPRRADVFYATVRRYYPGLQDGALQPGYAGIRPKIQPPGRPAPDFVIQGPAVHGHAGLVNLFGIESPGLTASIAIAERIPAVLEGAAP
jgi:L-2-hydroxyglutarate oxidase LhgO